MHRERGSQGRSGGGRKQKGRARVDREPSLPLSPPCPSPAPSCSCLSLCRSRASPSRTLASLLPVADSDSAILGLGSGIHRGSAAANTVYASRPGARAAVTKQACSRCPSLAALTRRAPSQKGVHGGVLPVSVSGKEGSTAPSFRPAPGTGAGLAGERSETTARRMDPRLACKRWPSERASPPALCPVRRCVQCASAAGSARASECEAAAGRCGASVLVSIQAHCAGSQKLSRSVMKLRPWPDIAQALSTVTRGLRPIADVVSLTDASETRVSQLPHRP